ncbi:hypothetical protein V7S43_015096 [Phytophthora oleae]|uniref:FYVE-type domain-containing protein n=1 Tax=Phytophthora oleae TaxID=2107226 RepID=A0ABD3EZ87_9STRA
MTQLIQPISLSPSDAKQLQVQVKTILDANVRRYQRFLDSDSGKVNPKTWKLVKTTHRTRVYLERQHRPAFTPFQVNPASIASTNADLQPMLCVGSTSGRLDDVVLEIANPPASCVSDLAKATLLSTLKLPTSAKPYRSVEVKWMKLNVQSKAVKNHDYVYVEATGSRRLPNGEKLGYHLLHSVDIPGVNRLPGRVRANLSVCSFFRQESKTSVSIYVLGMMDPMDDRVRRVVLPYFVNTLLSMFKRAPSVKVAELNDKCDLELKSPKSVMRDACVTCSKRPWRLGKVKTCNVCGGYVCSSCKVVKELNFMTPELEMTQRKVLFCSSCAINEHVSEFLFAETDSCTSSWGGTQENEQV